MPIGTFIPPSNEIPNQVPEEISLLGMKPDYSQDTDLEKYNKGVSTQLQNQESAQNMSLREKQFQITQQDAQQRQQMGNLLYQGQITTNALHIADLKEKNINLDYMQRLPQIGQDVKQQLDVDINDPQAGVTLQKNAADLMAKYPNAQAHSLIQQELQAKQALLQNYKTTALGADAEIVNQAARTGDIDPQVAAAVKAGQFDPQIAAAQARQNMAAKQAKAAGIDPQTLKFNDDGTLQPESEIAISSAVAARQAKIEAFKEAEKERAKESIYPTREVETAKARYGMLANIRMTETERKAAENVVSNYKSLIAKGIPLSDTEREEYETNIQRLNAIGQGNPNATLKPAQTQQERDTEIALQSQQKALDSMQANFSAGKDEKGNDLGFFNSKASMATRVAQQQAKVATLTSRLSGLRGQAAPPSGSVTPQAPASPAAAMKPVSRASLPLSLQNQPKGAIITLKDGTKYQVAD